MPGRIHWYVIYWNMGHLLFSEIIPNSPQKRYIHVILISYFIILCLAEITMSSSPRLALWAPTYALQHPVKMAEPATSWTAHPLNANARTNSAETNVKTELTLVWVTSVAMVAPVSIPMENPFANVPPVTRVHPAKSSTISARWILANLANA